MATTTTKKTTTTRAKSQANRTKTQAKRTQVTANRTTQQAKQTARSAERTVRTVVRDGAYATVGLGDTAVAFARTLPTKVSDLRVDAPKLAEVNITTLRNRAEREFDTLAERGRRIVEAAQRSGSTKDVRESSRTARRQVMNAATSIRKAVFATTDAIDRTFDAVEDTVEGAGRQAEREQYEAMTVAELNDLAARREVEGRSDMNKSELIKALLSA